MIFYEFKDEKEDEVWLMELSKSNLYWIPFLFVPRGSNWKPRIAKVIEVLDRQRDNELKPIVSGFKVVKKDDYDSGIESVKGFREMFVNTPVVAAE